MVIISEYKKKPMKWVETKAKEGKSEWHRVPVSCPHGKKMVMVILKDERTGATKTRHTFV